MRKWIAVLLAVVLVMGGSTTALAATQVWTLPKNLTFVDGTLTIGELQFSTLTSEQRAFMDKWLSIFEKKTSGRIACTYTPSGPGALITFLLFPDSFKVSDAVFAVSPSTPSMYLSSTNFGYMSFHCNTSSDFSSPYTFSDYQANCTAKLINLGALLYTNVTFNNTLGWEVPVDSVVINTDDEPEPSEPEPSIPEEPPVVVPPAEPPPVSGGNTEYVPYDVSVWNKFIGYIRNSAGASVNIVWLIIAMFTVVNLVYPAIKHFLSNGRNNGGESL